MRLASRMERIGTETAFEAAARARALEATGREVIHLEIGEPDFDTPRHVSEAAARALLDDGATHYTAATGILPLREAIVADVRRWKGIETTPEQVVVTPGAKPIMFYAMLALIDDGDEVIYPNPGFPIYESMARYVGGVPVAAPLREANDFRMDVDEVASLITDRTRLLVINSVSCTNAFAQYGAVAALTGPQDDADAYRAEFIARRSLMVDGLNAIPGVSCAMPHGAFYAFPNVTSFGCSSAQIADHLLYDAGVCGLAGTAFGSLGEGYLRFSYANSRENLALALERVAESLAKLERTGEPVRAAS